MFTPTLRCECAQPGQIADNQYNMRIVYTVKKSQGLGGYGFSLKKCLLRRFLHEYSLNFEVVF